jgi:hypothetical protein
MVSVPVAPAFLPVPPVIVSVPLPVILNGGALDKSMQPSPEPPFVKSKSPLELS